MRKRISSLVSLVCFTLAHVQFSLDIETGLAFQGYNDVRIPNGSSATEFSFNECFDLQGPVIPSRLRLG